MRRRSFSRSLVINLSCKSVQSILIFQRRERQQDRHIFDFHALSLINYIDNFSKLSKSIILIEKYSLRHLYIFLKSISHEDSGILRVYLSRKHYLLYTWHKSPSCLPIYRKKLKKLGTKLENSTVSFRNI